MLQNELLVSLVGDHKEVLIGDDWAESLVSAADKALSCAKDIEELLRIVVLAEGPKTATDAAGHDNTVVVHGCLIVFEKHFSFFAQIGF